MNPGFPFSRRPFLKRSGAAGLGLASFAGVSLAPARLCAAEAPGSGTDWTRKISDPVIRAGVEAAVFKNLIPAATERACPGHFTINADGGGFGSDTTWPGLDSWQMTSPYLQLGPRADGSGLLRFRPRLAAQRRQHPKPDGSVSADGSLKYCEYAAVLARVVFGNPDIFSA